MEGRGGSGDTPHAVGTDTAGVSAGETTRGEMLLGFGMRMLGAHEVCGAVETLSSSPLASHPTPAHPFALVLILCPRLTLPWYHYLVLCVHVRVWCCGGGHDFPRKE